MEPHPPALQSLFPLVNRRFQSFAEASDAALEVLARALPGTAVLGQIDPDEGVCRVADLRGAETDAVERRGLLPQLPDSAELDAEAMRARGIQTTISLPLELSDGSIVGIVCALSESANAYRSEHVLMLGLVARMLSYEWERVHSRAELRRLRHRLREGGGLADPDTGLPDRGAFTALLEREWRLAQRGTLGSTVIACTVRAEAEAEEAGASLARLAIKDAAEVLAAVARNTDHVGRVGEMTLAVVMVGSDDPAGAEALERRFLEALRRVTGSRPGQIGVSFGHASLQQAPSADQALAVAESAAEQAQTISTTPQVELL